MTKKVKRISVITLSAVLCVAIIAGILAWAAGNKNNNLTAEVIPVMNIASSYWDNDTSYGYVQSGYSQRIMASTEQQIQEFFVEEGDAVEIGDPILSYDPTAIQLEVERQELNLDSMEVRMDRLYRELNELKNTKPSDASGLSVVFVSGEGSSEESHTSVGEDSTQPEESFGEESAAEEDSSMPQESSSEVSSEEESSMEESSQPEESSGEESSQPEESSGEESSQPEESSAEESSQPEESSMEESSGEESSHPEDPEPEEGPITVLTDESKPYMGTGTLQDPYRYRIAQNAKLMQSFYERWIGLDPVYCVFEKYKLDDPKEELQYAWYMSTEGLTAPEKVEIWDLGVYLTSIDDLSMILAVAQEELPKEMVLSMNLKVYMDNVQAVTVVASDILTELPVEAGMVHLTLSRGGIFNLYGQENPQPGDDSSAEESVPEESYPEESFPEESFPDEPEPIPDPEPQGPTKEELERQIREKELEIRDLELSQRMAELELEKTRKKLEDTVVRSTVNGKVTSLTPDGALVGSPVAVVTGDEGFYVTGVMSEFNLEQVQVGQKVSGMSWMSGMSYEGTVTEVGEFPTEPQGWSSSDNMNASYYPFTVYFDDYSALEEGESIELTLTPNQSLEDTFCIPKMYIREENGRSYVLADRNGVLEKRYIELGRMLDGGYYMEVLSGLTMEDSIAFPYGKAAQEGIKTVPQGDELLM